MRFSRESMGRGSEFWRGLSKPQALRDHLA